MIRLAVYWTTRHLRGTTRKGLPYRILQSLLCFLLQYVVEPLEVLFNLFGKSKLEKRVNKKAVGKACFGKSKLEKRVKVILSALLIRVRAQSMAIRQ